MDRRSTWFVMLAALVAGSAGCNAPDTASPLPSAPSLPAAPSPVPSPVPAVDVPPPVGAVPVPDGCFAKFVQEPPAAGAKVDILFVADTSGSLDDEQDAVASALARLVSNIDGQGDYHIGVLPAHGSLGPSPGLLWKGEIDLCPSCAVSDPNVAGDLLRAKFEDLRSDPGGSDPASDGGEMGMYSLFRMMTDRFDAPENTGFVRDGAALAVIFLSDENDICAYPPLTSAAQTQPPDFHKFDPQLAELDEYNRTCRGSIEPNGSNVLGKLLGKKVGAPVFVGGIIYDDFHDLDPRYAFLRDPSVEDEIGYGYREMIHLAGGMTVDLRLATIDVAAFDQAIGALGGGVATQPIRIVQLDHAPLIPSTIHQYNLPSQTPVAPDPSDYDPVTNQVTLHDTGAPGGVVQINYCPAVQPCNATHDFCLEDAGPTPCPARDLYVVPFVPRATTVSFEGDTECDVCALTVQRHIEGQDDSDKNWPQVSGSPFTVLRNTTFTLGVSIAPNFGFSHYRFTYRRNHSGENGQPPKLDRCEFKVQAP